MAVLNILDDEVDDENDDKENDKDRCRVGRGIQVRSPASSPPFLLPVISYASSLNLLLGQRLIACGNSFELDQTVTTGVVSVLN